MNEELLKVIFENEGFAKRGISFEEFKEDMKDPEMQKIIHDKAGFGNRGISLEEFQSDLGASTQPVDGVAVQPEEQTIDPTQPDGTEDPGFWRNSWDGVKNWWQNTFIGMSTATGRQQARQAEALEAEEWLINRDLSTLSDDKIEILADSFKKTQDIQKRKGEQKMWLDSDSFLYQGLDAALSSLWGMLLQPGDVAGAAATGTATGAVVGGGVPGAIAGLGYGLSAGMIAAGADLEFSAAIMEHAQEYAQKHGLDVTNPKHLRQIFSDQEFSADAITDALIGTGIIVGADVVTLGAASKFGLTRSIAKGLRSAGINTKVGQTVAAAGLGSFSGGAGELGKQIVVDGEVNWREVWLEAFAEVGTGSLEVVASQYGYASKARARKTILDAAKAEVSREDFAAGLDEGVKKGIFDQTVRDALLADFDGAVQMLNSIPEDVVSDPITRNETLEALFDSFKVDEQIAALEAKIAETAEPLRPKLQKQLESLQEKKDKLNEYVGKLPDLKISAEDFSTKQKLFQKFANLGLVLKSGRSGITVKGGKAYVNDPITEDEYNILTDIVGQIQGLELDDSAADQVIAPQGTYKIDGEEATREQMLDVLQNNMEAVKAGEIDIEINDDPELFQVLQDATGIVTEEEGEVVVGEEAKEPLKTISTIEAEDLDQRISEVEDRRAKIKDKDSTEYKEATAELTTLKGERGRVEKYSNQTNEELSQELTQTEEDISTLQQKFDEKINTLVEQGASREEAVGIELRERNTGDQTSFETLNRNAELIESELISRQTPEQKALESREDIKRELSEDLGVDVEFNVDNTFEQPTTIGEGVEGVENTLRVQEAVNRLTELGYEPSERVVTQPTVQKPTEARKRTEAYMTRGRANLPAIQETKKETTQKLKSGKYSMLTAENPKSTALSERENAIRNRMAMNWLRRRGYDPIPIMGKFDTNPENSFLVEDLGYDDAVAFSKLFQQNGVATDVGLVYPDGSMNPRKKPGDSFDFETPPTLDNYSVIKTADGDLSISIGYDWTTTSSVDVAKAEVKYDDALRAKRKHDKESNVLFGAVQTELAGYDTERGKDSKGKQWVRSMDDSKPPTLVQSLNQFARSLGRDLKIADFPRQMSLDIRKRLVKMQKDSAKLTKRVQDSADRVAAEKKKVQDKLRREEEYGGLSRAEVERISQLIGEALSEDAIAKATNALQQIDPETRLIIHPNGAAFERATGEMGPGVEAVWDADSKTIHVNGAVANDRVLYHEVAHVVWSKLFANNPDRITEWADSIRSVLESGNEAEQKIAQELKGFIDQYKQEHADAANTTLQQLKAEEFFAELTSILVRNKAQISLPKQKSILKKIKDLLRKVFGNIPMLKDLNEFDDVVTMTNAIAEGIHEGNIAEIIGNIEGNKELEWGRRYSIDPKLRENPENITPLTREELGDVIYNHPKLLRKAVTPANEKYVFEKLDKVIKDHPNFLKDRGEWNKFWQKVPLLKNTTVIPAYAEGLGRMANGGVDGIMGELAVVTDKQRDLATHGLREADKIGKLYAEGKMTPIDTGLYFMWNILSIGMTAYTHEAGVLTALENNVQKWIGRAANGEFKTGKIETRKYKKKNYKTGKNEWVSETDDSAILDYFEWVDSFVTLNKASAGAKANLRAFGKRFLSKAEDIIPSGEFEGMRKLEALHSILEDRTSSTFDIRRKWVNNFKGMSFDNKIFDFVLLTTGRSDQFVIDRIRAEHFWDADNMKKKLGVEPQYSLYEAPKKSGLNGNGLSKLLNRITGLAFNEAASKALSPSIEEAYNRLGVTEFPTVGRFHWETWVAQSGQEVSHESLGAILQAKMGEVDDAGVRSGKFGDWDFNFEFRKYAGIPFRYEFLDDSGTKYVFDEEAYRKIGEEVRNQNSKRNWADGESRKGLNDAKANPYRFINYDKNNKIIKRETQISAKKRGRPLDKAWYHHDGVDTRRYFDYLRKVAVEVQESSPEYIDQTAIDDNAADVIGSESVSDNSFTGRQTSPIRAAKEIVSNEAEEIVSNEWMPKGKRFSLLPPEKTPQKTVKAYKLFTIDEGKIYPLFVNADNEVPVDQWIEASMPPVMFKNEKGRLRVPSKGTKGRAGTGTSTRIPDDKTRQELIKYEYLPKGSKATTIKTVAARPGWHAGVFPIADHIGSEIQVGKDEAQALRDAGIKVVTKGGKNYVKVRNEDQVWAEVEMPNDVDWQTVAEERGRNSKGNVVARDAEITDQIPDGGSYRYNTNKNAAEQWMIGGALKINRVLSQEEVAQINEGSDSRDAARLQEIEQVIAKATGKRFSIGRQTNPTRIAELAGLPENIIKNPVSPIKEIDKINISDNLREKLNLSSESQTIDLPINTTEIESVLSELNNKGYDTFIVGGAVRDALTGTAPKDLDIEVHGLSFDELHNTLKKYGKATEIKSSLDGFTGIISFIPEGGTAMAEPYEFSVPRVEKSTGIGKASFDITAGKEVGKSEAFLRRENTINAIGYNPVTKELYNPVNGLNDLNNKIIRQVSSAFSEDPSRVVRAMQFQSRFGLVPTDELYTLMRDMVEKGDLDTVPAELWGQNFNKMFSKGKDFTQVFKFMRKTGIAEKYFPEFLDLATTPQDSRWHPEGNVEEHTKQVMQKAHEIAERDNIQGDDRLVLMYSALLHDIAKPETTKTMPDGSITARGHEAAGVSIAESIMKRLKVKNDVVNRVLPIIQEHLAHATISSIPEMKGKKSAYRKLQNRLQAGKFKGTLQDLMWLMEADMLGRNNKNSQAPESLFEFYWLRDTLGDEKPLPLLQGRDLIKLGIPEGRTIGLYTRKAQQLQDSQMLTTKQDAIEWAKERIKADDIATYVAPETVETPIVQQDSMPENYQPNSIGPRRMGKRYSLNGKPLDHLVVEQIFREFPEMDIRALQQQLQLRGMNAKVEDLQILKNKVLGEQRKSSFFTKPGDISQAVIDELSVKIAKTATTKDALSQQFQRLFTSTSEHAKVSADGLVSLLDRLAKTFDLTLSEFIQQRVPFIGETTEDAILHLEDRVIKPLKNILEKNKIALSKAKTKKAKQAILNNIDAVNELLELLDGVTSDPVFQNDSAARAAIINGAAGRALLVGLTAPDTRTAVHEIFHIIEPYLNAEQRSVLKNAYKNAGGEIRDIDNLTYEESRDVSEYAARLWEDYFANGGHIGALKAAEGVSQGELTKLNNLFKSLWNALRSIIVSGYYNDIKVDIDQHPSVKKLFGELLALPADITAAEAELVNTNHKLINVEIEKILVSMGKNAPTPRERLTLDAQIRIANRNGYLSRDMTRELGIAFEILSQAESGKGVETSPEKVVAIGSAWARTKDLINENRRSMSEAKKRGENIEVFLLKEEKLHEDLMLYTQAYTHLGTSSARSQVYRNLMKDIFFSVKEYKDQVRFENKNIDPKDPIFKKYDALVDKYDKLYNRFSELSAELNEARNNDYATEAKKAYDDGIETTSKDKATPGEKNDAESAFKKFFGSGNIQYSDDANTNKYNVLSNYIKMLVATYPNEVGTFDKLVQRVLDDYQRLTAKGRPSADLTKADVIKGILFTQPREISEYQSKMAELKQIANRLDKLNNLSKGFEGQAKVNNKKPKHTDIQLMDEVIKEIVKIENKIKDHPTRRDELMTELLKVRDDIQTAFFNDNTIDLVAVDRLRDRVAALNDSVNDRVKNIEAQIKTIEAGNVPDSWMQAKESKTSKEINEELLFLQGELNALRNEFKVEQASMAHLNELYAKHGGKTLLGLNKVNLYYNKDILWGKGVWPSSLWNNARRYILGGDMSYVMLQGGLHLFKTLGTNMTALVGINRQAAAFDRKILHESLRDLSKVMYFGLTGKKEEILYMHREMMTSGRGAYAKAMGLIIAEPFAPQAIQFEEYYRSVGLGELRVEGQGFISNGLRKALGGMKRFDYFSEGGYLMYINQLKLETFNNIIRNNPNLDETTIRRLANRINNEFGRSSRPLGSGIAEMFAAPRYYMSRINLIGDSVKHIGGAISGDIVARRTYHTMINGAIGMILFQVAMEALGWDFDEDPRSKTFLRYRKGDKTVDLTMGMGKWLSILASMAVYWDEGDYGPNLIEQILGERKYLEPQNDYLNAPQKIFMKKAMDYSLHPGFDKLFWEPAALLGVVPATNKIGQPLGTSRTSRIGSWMIGFAPLGLQPIINAVALETIPGARDKVDIEEGFVPALERVSGEMFMTVFSSLGFANVDYDSTMKNVNVQNHLNAIKFDPAKSFTARHIKKYLPALENKGFDKQIIQTYRTEVLNSTGEDILGWLDKGWKPNEAMIKASIERHAFRIRRMYKDKYNI